MISMHLIDEPDVLYLLNDGRFPEDMQGYVVMDGPQYLGHALFRVENEVTYVLETKLTNHMVLDGAVRACIAAGENQGATHFSIAQTDEELKKWQQVFCKDAPMPAENTLIFKPCE